MSTPPIFDESGRPVGNAEAVPSHAAHAPSPDTSVFATDTPPEFQAMSMEQARSLLSREHGISVGKDDPILMLVTLHQGMCADVNRLLAGYSRSIQAMLTETGNSYADVVEQTLESLKDKTVRASLEQSFELVASLTKATETMKRRMWRFGMYHTFLVLITIASAVLALAVLLQAVR